MGAGVLGLVLVGLALVGGLLELGAALADGAGVAPRWPTSWLPRPHITMKTSAAATVTPIHAAAVL